MIEVKGSRREASARETRRAVVAAATGAMVAGLIVQPSGRGCDRSRPAPRKKPSRPPGVVRVMTRVSADVVR